MLSRQFWVGLATGATVIACATLLVNQYLVYTPERADVLRFSPVRVGSDRDAGLVREREVQQQQSQQESRQQSQKQSVLHDPSTTQCSVAGGRHMEAGASWLKTVANALFSMCTKWVGCNQRCACSSAAGIRRVTLCLLMVQACRSASPVMQQTDPQSISSTIEPRNSVVATCYSMLAQ